jgi:uncharacterized membrane protein
MIEFTVAIEIDRPVGAVFAWVTDPAKLPTWQTNTVAVEQVTDGPLGVGTRLRETHRAPGGRRLDSLVEVVAYEPDRHFALRILDGPLPIDGAFAFAPAASGTRVEMHGHGEPRGLMRMAAPLLARVLRRQFARDLASLKSVLEEPRLAS